MGSTVANDRRRHLVTLTAGLLAAALLYVRPAHGVGSTVSGVVSATDPPGAPVAGAFVAITGAGGQRTAVTDENGAFSLSAADGDYTLAAQAPGYAVGTAAVSVSGSSVEQNLSLEPSGAVFTALGVFGAQIASLAADGQSGIFYASTSVIPQVFRSADYGGSWTQVTMGLDDAEQGLPSTNVGAGLTTSGFPGELAVNVQGTVYASTDFGVTWFAVAMPGGGGGGGGPQNAGLFWGHAGSTNVLLNVTQSGTFRADMSATTPAFTQQTPSYLASQDDRMTVATATDGAWVAVVSAAGNLSVYDLADDTPDTAVSTLSGLPHPPTFVRLGGAKSAGVPPDAVLVYSNGGSNQAVMATKSGGTTYSSVSTATTVSGGCGEGPGSIGSIAPQSTGTGGNGTISQCWVTKSGTGSLTLQSISGINNNTGLVFDADYDGASNQVMLSGDGNRGVVKSAQQQSGVPSFPMTPAVASAGTDANSGGVAVEGITVPVVKDTTFGPAGATQVAVSLSPSGGGLGVASDDGGATFVPVIYKGGNATAWWTGASGTWLAFGHAGAGNLVTVVEGWTSSDAPIVGPNVNNTSFTDLGLSGGPGAATVSALVGAPGADLLFIGASNDAGNSSATGAVYRAAPSGTGNSVSFTGGTAIAGGSVTGTLVSGGINALAYCPTDGSAEAVQDVLLVATGTDSAGQVVRITGASGGSPVEAVVLSSVPPVNDVRVHCATGTVYAGTNGNGGGGLFKSTDGGATFDAVPIAGAGVPGNPNIRVVAISPDSAATVQIAANNEGFILETTDGGDTWTVLNNPQQGGRNFMSEGVGDIEIPPASAPIATGGIAPVVTGGSSLVGTGGGLFAADFSDGGPNPPPPGGGCTSASECDDSDQCTVDACSNATCSHTETPGVDSLTCEVNEIKNATCPDAKTLKLIKAQLGKFLGLVQKMVDAPKAKKKAKLKTAAGKLLDKLGKKIAKSKRTAADCKTEAAAALSELRALFDATAG